MFSYNFTIIDEKVALGQEPYYNGTLVFRLNTLKEAKALNFNENKDKVQALALVVLFHELGHQWSSSATLHYTDKSIDDCKDHIGLCTGVGVDKCLLKNSCLTFESDDLSTVVEGQLADPSFCEGHQQYFMNRLKARR